jgi:DNA-binding MarR family transcriptional regulator
VGVYVDETRRHQRALGIQHIPAIQVGSDGSDPAAIHADVGSLPLAPCPIDDEPAADRRLVHVDKLRPSLYKSTLVSNNNALGASFWQGRMVPLNRKTPQAAARQPTVGDRTWTAQESRAGFELLGDRIIDATRHWLRSGRRQHLQHDLYTIDGVELSLSQIDALESVADADRRMHELAARLHIDPSTATRTVAPLVDLGLLTREPDPGNRRYVVLRCTPSGRKAAARITKDRRRLMQKVLEPMHPQRRLLLAELLEEYLALTDAYGAADDGDAEEPSW